MNFKNFRIFVITAVALIIILAFGIAYTIIYTEWIFTPLALAIILMATSIYLIRHTEKTNIKLTHFLLSIKQGGFTSTFSKGKSNPTDAQLNSALNDIIQEFQKINLEKERQFQYLKTLNENIGVGLISYAEDGNIEMINPAAKSLLQKPLIRSISDLKTIDSKLHETISHLKAEEKRVIKTYIGQETLQLSVQLKEFIIDRKKVKLLLIQNLLFELDQKEVEAWQKLISVLTHEIMNSVTPIASLNSSVNQLLHQNNQQQLSPDDREDIYCSLDTIEKRSKGLIKFINVYKDFSKTPELTYSRFNLISIVNRLLQLLAPDMEKAKVQHELHCSSTEIKIWADQQLIEQVIINLLKNALEAVKETEKPLIKINIEAAINKTRISITNNGPWIPAEELEKIFIPFYSTKKGGSGIGLSLAKQIMKLHRGNIQAYSTENGNSTFTLTF
ncbi:ATP-binding protein [Fulvivirga maritima]|uniref:sensor histidine kinase n=1 Tax=Fulvivirga maritima TaxID=2904247 RepID=UPI001F47DC9E|nr:ATP-binding protein [Fulvivirga maritima]UII28136.1 ATP-binding protein [Fulvivirga maritima]